METRSREGGRGLEDDKDGGTKNGHYYTPNHDKQPAALEGESTEDEEVLGALTRAGSGGDPCPASKEPPAPPSPEASPSQGQASEDEPPPEELVKKSPPCRKKFLEFWVPC
ncbi:hypothetical protein DFAR_1560007 [Desulfarculales bacterium]